MDDISIYLSHLWLSSAQHLFMIEEVMIQTCISNYRVFCSHAIYLWLCLGILSFLGGPSYAQLFTMVGPGDVALEPHRLSGNRTTLLSDRKADTCFSITNEINGRYLWIKVMPLHPYLFRDAFSVFITGRDLSCSPMDGILVAVQPACDINGTCNIAIPCVAQVPTQMGELNYCKYRCLTPVIWDFIAMHITRFWSNTNTLMELCEVWFSN